MSPSDCPKRTGWQMGLSLGDEYVGFLGWLLNWEEPWLFCVSEKILVGLLSSYFRLSYTLLRYCVLS
jgi:hypothetical protein